MITYITHKTHVAVLWGKTEIGRMIQDGRWYYAPRACQGEIRSESFRKLQQLKDHIEKGETVCLKNHPTLR